MEIEVEQEDIDYLLRPVQHVSMHTVLELLLDSHTARFQEKLDGVRRILIKDKLGHVYALNKRGQAVEPAEDMIRLADGTTHNGWLASGELLKEKFNQKFYVFDLRASNTDAEYTYFNSYFNSQNRWIPEKRSQLAKAKLVLHLWRNDREGFVMRVGNDIYKYKFTKTMDVFIERDGSDHGSMFVTSSEGKPTKVGSVALPPNLKIEDGMVVEVKFRTKAKEEKKLIDARIIRVRNDKTPEECSADQVEQLSRYIDDVYLIDVIEKEFTNL